MQAATQKGHMRQVEKRAGALACAVTASVGVAALVWWLSLAPTVDLELRLPLEANITARRSAIATQVVDLSGTFLSFSGVASSLTGSWPRFRGEHFDNKSQETTRLLDSWGEAGPPVLWSLELGEGHAGPAVLDGLVYLLDYDEELHADSLRCFSLDDGAEVWRRSYPLKVKRNHGMSRTVPAAGGGIVVTIGPKCHVLCVEAATGEFRWGIDMVAKYASKVPLWYTGQCPLIDDGVVVLAPGGDALLVGVDSLTGEVLWETPNPKGWKMSHSSVIPMTFAGRKMYVYCAIGGVLGVAADGDEAGEVLWESDAWNHTVVAPSPVPLGDGRIFLTAGYGGGSMMIELEETDGQISAEVLYVLEKTVFSCEQQTPILHDGHLFGVLTNDAGAPKREFACLEASTGTVKWTSGKEERFGLGPFLLADGKIFILSDTGELTVIRADSGGYAKLDYAKVLDGRDAWAPMAIVDGRLLLRDSRRMICIDLRAAGQM